MPLYEYVCRRCDHAFEVLQRLGEDGRGLLCPACQSPQPVKQLSTFAGRSTSSAKAAPAGGRGACGGGGFT